MAGVDVWFPIAYRTRHGIVLVACRAVGEHVTCQYFGPFADEDAVRTFAFHFALDSLAAEPFCPTACGLPPEVVVRRPAERQAEALYDHVSPQAIRTPGYVTVAAQVKAQLEALGRTERPEPPDVDVVAVDVEQGTARVRVGKDERVVPVPAAAAYPDERERLAYIRAVAAGVVRHELWEQHRAQVAAARKSLVPHEDAQPNAE